MTINEFHYVHFVQGSVEFIESTDFQIEFDVNAASTDELAKFHYNYTDHQGSILVQVFKADPVLPPSPVQYSLFAIGGATLLAFVGSIVFVCWWNVYKRPHVQEHKILNPDVIEMDSSQAPLLDGRHLGQPDDQGANGARVRKRKKKSCASAGDDYGSSEDDGAHAHVNPNMSPQKVYGSPHKDLGTLQKAGSDCPTSGRTTPSQMSSIGDKSLVSYIKIGDKDSKQRGGQYIQLAGSEGSDLDKQSTLKIRRDNSLEGNTMPDVIKRGQTSDYGTGRRYVPLGGPNEPEYATINKLSGAHVATILGDRGAKTLPRTGERPVLSTFGGQPPRVPDRDEALELDSVSSSRSGESSTRTQSSYGDSLIGGDKRSDSDSVPSTASSGARSKDSGLYAGKSLLSTTRSNGHGGSFSSNDSGTGSCPRLVDEAYGTMGSQGSAGTIRSSSTASTGSGSSGSVITVIAAEDPNTGSLRRDGTAGRPPKYLQMNFLCIFAVLTLASGVMAQMYTEPTIVHIRVYAPPGFLKGVQTVYVTRGQEVNVTSNPSDMSSSSSTFIVHHYEVVNAILTTDVKPNKCRGIICNQGCDEIIGACICREGFRMQNGECVDIDECTEGMSTCSEGQKCRNEEGYHTCECREGFYRARNECVGQFEIINPL
ncbi:hypothetical protein CAPTEDRAFT_209260 [Capitella teleta]|uniref:EGF-like domain-containing protein n=1 Tax=Capitella teleta TaxID=283909 RepID=R7UFU3_CAPTE|nr:hypothetical protein CAPTEDRAFT_209260 [Capitella teleta]|eukprot:ELU02157.1 hypothetical protein CAPTEDRAFT_209260 [Capitella teleta]